MSKKNTSSRREFLGKALATAALLSPFVSDPKKLFTSGGNQTLGTFVVDLTLPENAVLLDVGGSKIILLPKPLLLPNNKIILTRTDTNAFVAVSGYCTHNAYALKAYNSQTKTIDCPNPLTNPDGSPIHGSKYDVNGVVVVGPADGQKTANLQVFTTTYAAGDTKVYIDVPLLTVKDGVLVSIPTLYQNFPNPVTAITIIRFKVDYYSKVTLTVADNLGHIIDVLADGSFSTGEYSFDFDASIFPSGTYFYRLDANGEVVTKQMVVIK
jgi:nitrite reductase/ring-hydroxylating ferredoxin subunit